MSKFVLDASVALKWVLNEPNRDRALELRENYRNGVHELIAPDVFPIEIGHVISKLYRQRKLSADDADAYVGEILASIPQLHPSFELFPRAFQLALQSRTSLFDCLYLALAEEQACTLVTADQRLSNAFPNAPIIQLSQLP